MIASSLLDTMYNLRPTSGGRSRRHVTINPATVTSRRANAYHTDARVQARPGLQIAKQRSIYVQLNHSANASRWRP